MAKTIFETLNLMLNADIAEGVKEGDTKYRLIRSETMLSAEYVRKKSGCRIEMGVGSDPRLISDLQSGKKKAVLFIVDMDEYKRFDKL